MLAEFRGNFISALVWPGFIFQILAEMAAKALHPEDEDDKNISVREKVRVLFGGIVVLLIGALLPYTNNYNPVVMFLIGYMFTSLIVAATLSIVVKRGSKLSHWISALSVPVFLLAQLAMLPAVLVWLVLSLKWLVGLFV